MSELSKLIRRLTDAANHKVGLGSTRYVEVGDLGAALGALNERALIEAIADATGSTLVEVMVVHTDPRRTIQELLADPHDEYCLLSRIQNDFGIDLPKGSFWGDAPTIRTVAELSAAISAAAR